MIRAIPNVKQVLFYLVQFENRLNFLEQQRYKLTETYFTLRSSIGMLGMCLPFIVSLGGAFIFGAQLQSSISAYYYTGMHDFLVGILWVIGFFLLSYKGYDLEDQIAAKFACVLCIGMAVFPIAPQGTSDSHQLLIGTIHQICAGMLFLTLTFFSIFLFTRTDPDLPPTRRKIMRNWIYLICGLVMFACTLLMVLYNLLPSDTAISASLDRPIYWLEATAILAFGISWFVKGEGILKDEM